MRIIGGKYKGRKIQMPSGIRPTQEKVRKAIFDILGDAQGLFFLELFAGSGAVALEAESRGAKDVLMVESNRECQLIIRKNIEALKASGCSLYPQEVEKAIMRLYQNKRIFDIIFVDPPYCKGRVGVPLSAGMPNLKGKVGMLPSAAKNTLQTLEAYDILAPDGFIVVQHFKRDELPEETGQLKLIKAAKYGDTLLSFYRKIGR